MVSNRVTYATVSIPNAIAEEIDELIKELGYWPSRSAFVREACLEKVRREQEMLRRLSEAEDRSEQSGG